MERILIYYISNSTERRNYKTQFIKSFNTIKRKMKLKIIKTIINYFNKTNHQYQYVITASFIATKSESIRLLYYEILNNNI